MDVIPKELEENQLKLEIYIDPHTKFITMTTHMDDKSEPSAVIPAEGVPKDPLLELKTEEPVDLILAENVSEDPLIKLQREPCDFDQMTELDQLICMERQRLLNIRMPKKTEDPSYDRDVYETDSSHQLTQNEKSRLRMRKLREKESAEEYEYRKFRSRVQTLKTRLLQKLRNFEDEAYLKEISKRACDRTKQNRLKLKATETPNQEALRKKQVNLARRRLFLRNKAFRTAEDLLREKEKRRTKYLERTWLRRSEEQCVAKRKQAAEKAKEKRRENNKEWVAIQKAVKGRITEGINVSCN